MIFLARSVVVCESSTVRRAYPKRLIVVGASGGLCAGIFAFVSCCSYRRFCFLSWARKSSGSELARGIVFIGHFPYHVFLPVGEGQFQVFDDSYRLDVLGKGHSSRPLSALCRSETTRKGIVRIDAAEARETAVEIHRWSRICIFVISRFCGHFNILVY